MGHIYKITNSINQKPYVGKTVSSIQERWRDHVYEAFTKHSSYLIHQAMRKYGIENFKIEELEQCPNDILSEREQYWIKTINSHFKEGYGYNMTLGGDGALVYSDKDILELWNQGLKSCQIAERLGANKCTISKRLKELKPGEARKRHANANKKSVLQYDLNGNFIKKWDCANYAEKELQISAGSISRCCKKERTMASNSLWKYATDETPVEELMINYAKSQKCNQVDMYDMEGNYIRSFESGRQAELELNLTRGRVSEICNHTQGRRSVGGYKWEWSYPLKRMLIELK